MELIPPTCSTLSHPPSISRFTFQLVIVLGILISYLPQHHRIISRRSSEGLSPYFVLLGTTSSSFSIANVITLPQSQENLACCKYVNHFECVAGLLGIAQIGVQWACFCIIMFLFLIFFPRPNTEENTGPSVSAPTIRTALFVVFTCILHIIALFIISSVLLLFYPSHLLSWATFCGISAAVLACIQYIPQLYTTWKLQHVMSLSIPMMCIQTPGSFVFAASLAGEYGWKGWSVWGVYVLTGCLQGGLLAMGILFEVKDRRAKASDDAEDERRPLLGYGDGSGPQNHRTIDT